jgi:spermidine/putrescine-binding protein
MTVDRSGDRAAKDDGRGGSAASREAGRGLSPDLLRGLISRRTMLAGVGALSASAFLAACGTAGYAYKGDPAGQAAKDTSDSDKVINWSNWPEYIDVDDKTQKRPTLDEFTKKTGIKVNYTEDYSDNDVFFAKVKPQLAANADTGRDVWCSTDWMAAKMIRLKWVQKFEKANMPNAKNLVDSLVDVSFDPGRQYSIPWQSGFTGIAYNPKSTGGKKITTMDQLLNDPAIKGRVTCLTEMRDTVGLMLLAMGKDPAQFTDDDFSAAIDVLNKAKHKKNAELLINYYYDPAVMATVEDYVNYIPPVKGVKEALVAEDPDVADNPLIFPSDAVQAHSHVFMGLTEFQENDYNSAFLDLIGG